MKPILLTAVAVSAVVAGTAIAQQADDAFEPGVNFLSNWDADEDGKITLEELNERRGDIFSAFDENEDGKLSAEEFGAYDQTRTESMQRPEDRGNGTRQGEQAIGLAATDSNKDGHVTLEEFLAASAAWMGVMDRNNDSIVTIDDFGLGGGRQGQNMGNGQGRGQGQGKGQGQGNGRQGRMQDQQDGQQAQGRGNGQGRGKGGRAQAGMSSDQQQGQRGGNGRGNGQKQGHRGGQGKGNAQQGVTVQAFPSADGALWIVDGRTGDILMCKAVIDSTAAAGFVPVCLEPQL